MKQLKLNLGVLIILFWFFTPKAICQKNSWVAPANADQLKNPLKGNAEAIKQGKAIFESMCVVCHGEKGKGDGAASVTLAPPPANFLAIKVRDESDGAIFWKLTNGNPPMASYKDLLNEIQRWQVVNYISQLESQSK